MANVQAAQKQGIDGRFDLAEFHQEKMWAGGFGVWVPRAWEMRAGGGGTVSTSRLVNALVTVEPAFRRAGPRR